MPRVLEWSVECFGGALSVPRSLECIVWSAMPPSSAAAWSAALRMPRSLEVRRPVASSVLCFLWRVSPWITTRAHSTLHARMIDTMEGYVVTRKRFADKDEKSITMTTGIADFEHFEK